MSPIPSNTPKRTCKWVNTLMSLSPRRGEFCGRDVPNGLLFCKMCTTRQDTRNSDIQIKKIVDDAIQDKEAFETLHGITPSAFEILPEMRRFN